MSSPVEQCAFAAIIVAGGTGSRMGAGPAKQYRDVAGKPVLRHSIDAFAAHSHCDIIILVVADSDRDRADAICAGLTKKVVIIVGGHTRRASVRAGLNHLTAMDMPPPFVLIHDAARPGVDEGVIDRLIDALHTNAGALPALPVTDSVARVRDGAIDEPVDREALVRVQTPQAFHLDAIVEAHRAWPEEKEATDDAAVLRAAGGTVVVVPGTEKLMKLTYPVDFSVFATMTGAERMRIGQGYDVHALVEGKQLWLCGIRIDHSHGLSGHSDADVAIHALCDALFGAIGNGDIGVHFPPSDEKWRGVSSALFLEYAMNLVRQTGLAVANCDLTIICEAPKIGPHREAMRTRLADIMAIDPSRISIKGTTSEGLGFTGRHEGIAAQAVVLLQNENG